MTAAWTAAGLPTQGMLCTALSDIVTVAIASLQNVEYKAAGMGGTLKPLLDKAEERRKV